MESDPRGFRTLQPSRSLGTLWSQPAKPPMESRRLVVWISAGILGFQGATFAFDLLN
jgi:hypothetical protein